MTTLPGRDLTPQDRVNLAVAYIDRHLGERIRLRDLAVAAGVGNRTIGYLFLQTYGTTPMAFVRAKRLAQAHRLLLEADPATTTVINIARRCGFTHMGQFSQDYKRTIGEPPSTTLRRTSSVRAKARTTSGSRKRDRRPRK